MERIEKYRGIVLRVLNEWTEGPPTYGEMIDESLLTGKPIAICGGPEAISNINASTLVLSELILSMESCGSNRIIPKALRPN